MKRIEEWTDQDLRALMRLVTDPTNHCQSCGGPCLKEWKFCSFCGAENSNFDEAECASQFGQPLESLQADCRTGHRRWLEAYEADLEDWPEFRDRPYDQPYCRYCGQKVLAT